MIQRYEANADCKECLGCHAHLSMDANGEAVLFADHAAEVAALRAKVERLRDAATLALEAIEAGEIAPAVVALRWAKEASRG